jgi:hypothetical protein
MGGRAIFDAMSMQLQRQTRSSIPACSGPGSPTQSKSREALNQRRAPGVAGARSGFTPPTARFVPLGPDLEPDEANCAGLRLQKLDA